MSLMRFVSLVLPRRLTTGRALPVLWAIPPRQAATAAIVGSSPTSVGDAGEADPSDMSRLMEDHSDAVFRLALSIVRDRALAEDVTQETMVKAWLALPTFRGESSLRSWVMRIGHNTAISMLRSRRALVSDPAEMPEPPTTPAASVERRVEGAAALDDFTEALDLLDDLSRSIVVLREIEGLSYEDIARILDVPLPTVKTRLLRARRRLGVALEGWR
jgi:RNA polymerase sigma-70 factor (ECF subfamily)